MRLNLKCSVGQALRVVGDPEEENVSVAALNRALRLAARTIPDATLAEVELEPLDLESGGAFGEQDGFLSTSAVNIRLPWKKSDHGVGGIFWVAGLPYTALRDDPEGIRAAGKTVFGLFLERGAPEYAEKPSPEEQSFYQMHHGGPIFRIKCGGKNGLLTLKPMRRYTLNSFRLSKADSPLSAAREIEIRFTIADEVRGAPCVEIRAFSGPVQSKSVRSFAEQAAKLSRRNLRVMFGDFRSEPEDITEAMWAREEALEFIEEYRRNAGVPLGDSFLGRVRSAVDAFYGKGVRHATPLANLAIAAAHSNGENEGASARLAISRAVDLGVGAQALPVLFKSKRQEVKVALCNMFDDRGRKDALRGQTKALVAENKTAGATKPPLFL